MRRISGLGGMLVLACTPADPEMVGARDGNVQDAFERVEPTYDFVYEEEGNPLASWTITVCRGYRGFPAQMLQNRANY